MSQKMCGAHKIAGILLIVGGLNWLLVGILKQDLFSLSGLGMDNTVARAVYILIGLSALSMFGLCKCCMKGICGCGRNECTGNKSMNEPEAPKQM